MKNGSKLFVLLLVCLFVNTLSLSAQNKTSGDFTSGVDIFGTRVFVENNKQFDDAIKNNDKVLYALENGSEKIYFTNKGLVYKLVKKQPLTHEMREAIEHGEKLELKPDKVYFVEMRWENANPNIQIEESEKLSHYFTYGSQELNSNAFKKITYKNVYNGIDFEYTIPNNKEHGIKYNVIINPGANANDIQMIYSGDVKKIITNETGDVIIKTPLENITEHAPSTFNQNNQSVPSAFNLNKNTLSFNFPDGYDNSKTLIIDPWITTITSLVTNNYGFDVDYDYAGNVFVYGGNDPYQVSMYNSAGLLQWTFSGVVATPFWTTGPYAGNFVVNKSTGKSYIGQGFDGAGTSIIRLTNLGIYDNFMTPPNVNWNECWDMGFHCATGDIYAFGGGTSGNVSAGIINQASATVSPTTFFPSDPSPDQDIVSHAIDDAGNVFVYYAQGSYSYFSLFNKIVRLNAAVTSTVWNVPSTYTTLSEALNKNGYVGASISTSGYSSNGFNCLAVNSNYLYFYDGFNLAAYNKTTGTKIGFITITGNTTLAQGGIAVDECDNIYVGGNGSVLCYSFNGTSFTTKPSIPLGASTINKYVYDIKLNKATGTLYVCGSGFVGTYTAIPCAYSSVITTNTVICGGGSFQLNAPFSTSYSWNGPLSFTSNIQNPVLNPVTPSMAGTYSVVMSPNFCTGATLAITNVTVIPFTGIAASNTGPYCAGDTIFLNVSASSSYSWTGPGGFTSNSQNPFLANASPTMSGIYSVQLAGSSPCGTVSTTSVTVNPFPNLVISALGGTVVGCSPSTLTLSVANTNTAITNMTYTWTSLTTTGTAVSTNSLISVTAPGGTNTLVVFGTDPANGACLASATIAITQNTTAPTIAVNPISQTLTCNGACKTFTASTTSGTANIVGTWYDPAGVPSPSSGTPLLICANSPGTYTAQFCNTINGCCASQTVSVASNTAIPTISVTSVLGGYVLNCTKPCLPFNINSSGTLAVTGYTWTNLTTNVVTSPPGFNGGYTVCITGPNKPGSYEAAFIDGNNCKVTTTINVTIDTLRPSPLSVTNLPSNSYTINCFTPTLTATALSTPLYSPSSYSWTQPPNLIINSNTISIGMLNVTSNPTTYTVSAMAPNGCVGKQKVFFYKDIAVPSYSIAYTPSAITCANPCVALTATTTTTVNVTYTFTSPPPTTTATTAGALMCTPGQYTLTTQNIKNGCLGTATVNVPLNVVPPTTLALAPIYLLCGQTTTTLTAGLTASASSSYSYTWYGPFLAGMSCPGGTGCYSTAVNAPGAYFVSITNTVNGCTASNSVIVISGGITASITPNPSSGYSPLTVNFGNGTNLGSLTNGTVTTTWNYGNGISTTYTGSAASYSLTGPPNGNTTYQSAGTYTVWLIVSQNTGTNICVGTASTVIVVDLPSQLTTPNVFTPNGDGVNDYFTLLTTNITDISCQIYDRWGVKMYDVRSDKGNISWDGKNLSGKDVPAGTYFYILKAEGKDGKTSWIDDKGQEIKQHGSISLYR